MQCCLVREAAGERSCTVFFPLYIHGLEPVGPSLLEVSYEADFVFSGLVGHLISLIIHIVGHEIRAGPDKLHMHHVIATEEPVTDRQNIVERAGEEEEQDHSCEYGDDDSMVSLNGDGYCGHGRSSCVV